MFFIRLWIIIIIIIYKFILETSFYVRAPLSPHHFMRSSSGPAVLPGLPALGQPATHP